MPIYEIKYFQFSIKFGQPAGYVVHGKVDSWSKNLIIAVGPFLVNTLVGAVVGVGAAIRVLQLENADLLDLFLVWLGVSIAMHAFPSTGDAKSIVQGMKQSEHGLIGKLVAWPVVGLIYIGALGSMLWLDLLWGVAVVGFLPDLIVKLAA